MYIAPNSILKVLARVPLDNKYKNTLYFADRSAQQTYFASKYKYNLDNYTYMREQKKIRVGIKADNLYDCNYLMYQNTSFGTKWFYAFITKVEYINNELTEISFEIDVMQTWLVNYDYDIKSSFVEREHVTDDTMFTNLLDEKLEYGEYVYKEYQKSNLFNSLSFVLGISDLTPVLPDGVKANPRIYDGLLSGLVYWAFDESNVTGLIEFINTYYQGANTSAIEYIFTIPTAFLPDGMDGQILSGEVGQALDWNYQPVHDTIDGYTPKNNKLFNYPYTTLSVSNNTGTFAIYRFEDFLHPDNIHFNLQSNIAPNPTVMCIPRNYKKHIDFNSSVPEYGIALNGFPQCSWTTDTYRAWLAQNGLPVLGGVVAGLGATLVGGLTGNVLAIGGGIASVYSQMAQVYKASIQPDQAKGNVNNGSFNIAHGMQDFYLQHVTIKREFAERIDNYFSMYGYKVNTVKVPNINTRPHWNYVKTIDVCLTGSVPADDMEKLHEIYDKGVTFWKYASEVGDYTLDNSI